MLHFGERGSDGPSTDSRLCRGVRQSGGRLEDVCREGSEQDNRGSREERCIFERLRSKDRVLRDLVAPKKPSYADVVAHLKAHFDPKQGVVPIQLSISRTRRMSCKVHCATSTFSNRLLVW